MKNNEYLEKCVEYALYHDNYERKSDLPGLVNGLPEKKFFNNTPSPHISIQLSVCLIFYVVYILKYQVL